MRVLNDLRPSPLDAKLQAREIKVTLFLAPWLPALCLPTLPARDRPHPQPPLRLGVFQVPLWKPWHAHARRGFHQRGSISAVNRKRLRSTGFFCSIYPPSSGCGRTRIPGAACRSDGEVAKNGAAKPSAIALRFPIPVSLSEWE